MSFPKYRNHRECMGYEAGTVFRLLFKTSAPSIQLFSPTPAGVFLLNESTSQILNATKEDFEEFFQPSSWEWMHEPIAIKEKAHKVKVGWLVKRKEVLEHHAEFWHHPLKVVGFHHHSGVYAKAVDGRFVYIPQPPLIDGMFTITPNIEENE